MNSTPWALYKKPSLATGGISIISSFLQDAHVSTSGEHLIVSAKALDIFLMVNTNDLASYFYPFLLWIIYTTDSLWDWKMALLVLEYQDTFLD